MSGSSYGQIFKLTTFGESHGVAIGGIIEGFPSNFSLDLAAVQLALDKRRPGQSGLVSPRNEKDELEILSGLFDGKTTGSPIAFLIKTKEKGNWRFHYFGTDHDVHQVAQSLNIEESRTERFTKDRSGFKVMRQTMSNNFSDMMADYFKSKS